jgi:subtilisin family serine protease
VVEPDYRAKAILLPNDPLYSTEQWHLPKIEAPVAWDSSVGSSGVTIAVLDTGVSPSHPDLAGRVLQGYDFINRDFDANDDQGHGTAVAGSRQRGATMASA